MKTNPNTPVKKKDYKMAPLKGFTGSRDAAAGEAVRIRLKNKKIKDRKHSNMAKKFGAEAIADRYMAMKKRKGIVEVRIRGSKLSKDVKDKAKFGSGFQDRPVMRASLKRSVRALAKKDTSMFKDAGFKKKVQEMSIKKSATDWLGKSKNRVVKKMAAKKQSKSKIKGQGVDWLKNYKAKIQEAKMKGSKLSKYKKDSLQGTNPADGPSAGKGLLRAAQKRTKNAITNRKPGYFQGLSKATAAIKKRFAEGKQLPKFSRKWEPHIYTSDYDKKSNGKGKLRISLRKKNSRSETGYKYAHSTDRQMKNQDEAFIPDKELAKTPNKGLNNMLRGRKANLIKAKTRRAIAKNGGKTLPIGWKHMAQFKEESAGPTDDDLKSAQQDVKSRKERKKLKMPPAKMDKRSVAQIGASVRVAGKRAKRMSQIKALKADHAAFKAKVREALNPDAHGDSVNKKGLRPGQRAMLKPVRAHRLAVSRKLHKAKGLTQKHPYGKPKASKAT